MKNAPQIVVNVLIFSVSFCDNSLVSVVIALLVNLLISIIYFEPTKNLGYFQFIHFFLLMEK